MTPPPDQSSEPVRITSNSRIRMYAAATNDADVAQSLIEARELIRSMAQYMRWTLPGQSPETDSRKREWLLAEAEAWEASLR